MKGCEKMWGMAAKSWKGQYGNRQCNRLITGDSGDKYQNTFRNIFHVRYTYWAEQDTCLGTRESMECNVLVLAIMKCFCKRKLGYSKCWC